MWKRLLITVVWYKERTLGTFSNAVSPSFYIQFHKIIEGSIILRRISLLRTNFDCEVGTVLHKIYAVYSLYLVTSKGFKAVF
jgi:hypothetical protein